MSSLRELQHAMAAALLEGGGPALAHLVAADGLGADARVGIYRHHVLTTLTAVLASTYPVARRLVHEAFFAYLADVYIRRHPPAGPCLFEYGEELPALLEALPACRALPYLPDVARLEWALAAAIGAEDR